MALNCYGTRLLKPHKGPVIEFIGTAGGEVESGSR